MLRSLVGSEMCIRDSINAEYGIPKSTTMMAPNHFSPRELDAMRQSQSPTVTHVAINNPNDQVLVSQRAQSVEGLSLSQFLDLLHNERSESIPPREQMRMHVGRTPDEMSRNSYPFTCARVETQPADAVPIPTSRHQCLPDITECYSSLPGVRQQVGPTLVSSAAALFASGVPSRLLEMLLKHTAYAAIQDAPMTAFLPAPLPPPEYGYPNWETGILDESTRDGVGAIYLGYNTATGFPLGSPITIKVEGCGPIVAMSVEASAESTIAHLTRHVFHESGMRLPTDTQGQPWNVHIKNPKPSNSFDDVPKDDLGLLIEEAPSYEARPTRPGVMVGSALQSSETLSELGISDGALLRWEEDREVMIPQICIGRPFRTGAGACLVASTGPECDGAWNQEATEPVLLKPEAVLPIPSRGPDELSEDERSAIAAGWLGDALAEHASVGSFARCMLELMAVAAPPELLSAASLAANDEVIHAQLCFALAKEYGAGAIGPGPLDIAAAGAPSSDIVHITRAVVLEGCVGETVSAALAAAARDRATAGSVVAALAKITSDETRHSQLAWKTARWALSKGGQDVREAVEDVLADPFKYAPGVSDNGLEIQSVGEAHGRLSAVTQREVIDQAVRCVVQPCAAMLMRGEIPREMGAQQVLREAIMEALC
eukprot:TRINITY_DN28860_c0_g1_i2.p1 TRINITY_DN28860_c0_g1~~TRINITY_DN28860_c0_g1_i2.p1  ORF type:complete len:658 (-),score=146.50 TRINITY_DN28860_c0_g1_i2:315-2288(-)